MRSIPAIFRVWALFYISFFSASSLSPPDQDFFLHNLDRLLSTQEASPCEGVIALEECATPLESLNEISRLV